MISTTKNENAINSFVSIRKLIQTTSKALLNEIMSSNAEIENIRSTYSKAVAEEKISNLRLDIRKKTHDRQDELKADVDNFILIKKQAISDYIAKPMRDEHLKLLQGLSLRGSISKSEIEMLMSKMSDNYQEISALQSIAEKNGFKISLPFDPEESLQKLDEARSLCLNAIKDIGKENKDIQYMNFMFLNGRDEDTQDYISMSFAELDKDPSLIVEVPELTLLEKLEDAEQKATESENYAKAMKIHQFVEQNKEDLYEDGEKQARIKAKGITLIDLPE